MSPEPFGGMDGWSIGAGCWVLGAGCWVLGAGCWVLSACRTQATCLSLRPATPNSRHARMVAGRRIYSRPMQNTRP
ncbi:MAG TPA: hypothetical protein VFJ16_22920 [Longimicrobium sp.]|nr:hypothetical protein [Longimicrobium sp.]